MHKLVEVGRRHPLRVGVVLVVLLVLIVGGLTFGKNWYKNHKTTSIINKIKKTHVSATPDDNYASLQRELVQNAKSSAEKAQSLIGLANTYNMQGKNQQALDIYMQVKNMGADAQLSQIQIADLDRQIALMRMRLQAAQNSGLQKGDQSKAGL